MARIAGVDLPRDKRVEIGLTYIYGIGRTSNGCRRSDATEVSVTERACLFVVRKQRPTQEPAKVLRELLQIRRNNLTSSPI